MEGKGIVLGVKDNLKSMCLIPAVSGHEYPVAHFMEQAFLSCGFTPVIDVMGNCMTTVEGTDAGLPSVMVFGHMDQLGFLVRNIEEDGFLRLERLGGVPERVMPARNICVITRDGSLINGIIGMKSHHVTPAEEKYIVRKISDSYADIGAASKEQVKSLGIDVGSPVVYAPGFIELLNQVVSATSLDNRIACSVVLELARRLAEKPIRNTVHLVGTVQEEYNDRGAMLAARAKQPSIAICIDVCIEHGTPDMKGQGEVIMGHGPVISLYNFHGRGTLNGVIPHGDMVRLFERASDVSGISVQRSVSLGLLTDLAYVQFEGLGMKAIDIGVPCRYTHSPTEVCSIVDVEQTADLIYTALTLLPE
jgi:putative aminopeptidase FrvX